MARVTVRDCLDNVDNRFELIMLATERVRRLATGGKEPKVARESDKPIIVALHKIASSLIDENVVQQGDIVEDEPLFATFDDEASTKAL